MTERMLYTGMTARVERRIGEAVRTGSGAHTRRRPHNHRVLVTNHVLSGAVIGHAVRSAPGAFVTGLVSHLALDAVPHWGGRPLEDVMHVAVADGLTGLLVMAATTLGTDRDRRLRVLAGMAGAAFLDLDKPSRVFLGLSPFPAAVDALHARVQRESPRRMPQELLVGLGGALVVAALSGRGRRAACHTPVHDRDLPQLHAGR